MIPVDQLRKAVGELVETVMAKLLPTTLIMLIVIFVGAAVGFTILTMFPEDVRTESGWQETTKTMRLSPRQGGCYKVYLQNERGLWELRGQLCGDLDGH